MPGREGLVLHVPSRSLDLQKFLRETEQIRIERELALMQIRESRRLALKLAEEREKLNWSLCGGALVVVLSTLSSFHHKNLLHMLPVFPTATFLGYKAHFCYGDQLQRIKENSLNLIEKDDERLNLFPASLNEMKGMKSALFDEIKRDADEKMELRLAMLDLNNNQNEALELSKRREQFGFEVLAAATTTAVLLAAGSIYKRKDLVVPIVPLIMGIGYRYDAAFGTNRESIRESAEKILKTNPELVQPIAGAITLRQIDEYRKANFQK
ncbi:unnamed protein product [Caenorhabditis auriculariae]|uniref:Plasminogen receptor (KT) n=1 Tax=Caenorhabditis auriculariae TaxID=2777116 RepID=A0A8S1HFX5_9PELO|nr:unnamed protein product [Caenorhabditis auriculariae]